MAERVQAIQNSSGQSAAEDGATLSASVHTVAKALVGEIITCELTYRHPLARIRL